MMFKHMSGAGNTFLVADGRSTEAQLTREDVHAILRDNPRRDGQPIEGVLVLRNVLDNTFTADYYNPDGSYGMMCGNGARCIVRFAIDHGVNADVVIHMSLNNAPYMARAHRSNVVSIELPAPVLETHYPVGSLAGVEADVYYVNVRSDHAVIGGPLDATRPIVQILRHHTAFPNGVNVNMAEIVNMSAVRLATFERGVEAITGACGTGAVSTALALWRQGLTADVVTCIPPSGRELLVTIKHANGTVLGFSLQGDAEYDNG